MNDPNCQHVIENGFSNQLPNGKPKETPPFPFAQPPDPMSNGWVDITEKFTNAAKSLQLGELVHDASFSLFEGMSAIELMDPKMDAGMLQRSHTKPVTFDDAVENGILKLENVPRMEQIAIMDATMACVLTWLEGHSLAQTVFTNLYMHQPLRIEDRTLKAYVIGTLKLVGLCSQIIRSASVFEEEDFQSTTYGFNLCTEISENRVSGMLKEADDDCQKAIRGLKYNATNDAQENIDHYEAVSIRVRFLRNLLIALIALTGKDEQKFAAIMAGSARVQNFQEAQRVLEQCKSLVDKISTTAALGTPYKDEDDEGMYTFLACFVPNVNQRLLPPTFPRKTKLLNPTATFDYLRRLVQQLLTCCNLLDRVVSFNTTLEFFREFSRKDNCLLSRSVLQVAYNILVGKGSGKNVFEDAIKEAIRDFIQPPVLHPKCALLNEQHCKQTWDDFMAYCGRVLSDLLRLCGYNRARQRDRLAVVLEDLATLQEEADRVDSILHTALNRSNNPAAALTRHHLACLGSFILYHILVAMLDYLLLGFELELYSMHEYAYIYWYAHEFLYKWLINVLHKADNFIYDQDQAASKLDKKGEKKKKAVKKKPPKMHRLEIVHLQSKQKLCEGYYRMMLGFYALKRIRLPSYAGSDEYDCVRYEHRLAPFAHLTTPPMVGYSQFLNISNFKEVITSVPASRLFTEGAQSFDEARLSLENVPSPDEAENTILTRICKMNVVILRLLASGHQSDAKEWPIFDFQLHCDFPIVRLK